MSAIAHGGPGNSSKAALASGVGGILSLTKPANTENGDFLVTVIYGRGETTGMPIPTPQGWARALVDMPNNSIGQVNTFYRYVPNAALEPATYEFSLAGGNRKTGLLFRVTGADSNAFLSAAGVATTTRGGTEGHTATTVPNVTSRDVTALTIMGVNFSAPKVPPDVLTFRDDINSEPIDWATTGGAAGESTVYVMARRILEREPLGVSHVTMPISPDSGVAYVLIVNSAGMPPEVSAGPSLRLDAGETVRLDARVTYGVADWLDWSIVGETPPNLYVHPNGSYLTFTTPYVPDTKTFTIRLRGRNTAEANVNWSDYVVVQVEVKPHQAWMKKDWGMKPILDFPPVWTLKDDALTRPGDVYLAEGITVPEMLAKTTFFSAHRGGGDEFPEHTMEAYAGAAAGGLDALEVSVRVTKDGEMVCFHDDTLDRTTNGSGLLSNYTYQELVDNIRVTRSPILGPGQPDVLIPKVTDVLARFAGKKIIFLEGKDGAAHARLFAEIDKYAQRGLVLSDWFIQKQFYSGGTWTKDAARARGIKVWGYMGVDTTDAQLDTEDAKVDLWGVPDMMPLSRKAQIVARGKPVICWEVHRRAQVEEHQSIGLKGQMSSSALYVSRTTQRQTADSFATRRKAPGDMWSANIAVDNIALTYDGMGGANHKFPDPICSTVMGSMCPIAPGATISMRMSWNVRPTSGASGVAFGCRNDEIFRPVSTYNNKVGGYYLAVSGAQRIATLYRYDPGVYAPVQLASAALSDYVSGDPLDVTVRTTPNGVECTVGGWTLQSTDKTYNGRYFHICQGNTVTLTTFRNIQV